MPEVFLFGGGWNPGAAGATYRRFLAAAGTAPRIVTVLLDDPGQEQYFSLFAEVLLAAGAGEVEPVFVAPDRGLRLGDLAGADGMFVGGGCTPGYRDALAGVRPTLGPWLAENNVVYGGFSAGARVAAETAVIGGWKIRGTGGGLVPTCPEEVAEELDEISLTAGLGLVPFAVEVHASAWGTLSRLVAMVEAGLVPQGWAIDEDTMLAIDGDRVTVHGVGRAYHVCMGATRVAVDVVPAAAAVATAG